MNISPILSSLAYGLRDAIAPSRCIDCLAEGTWYCDTCRRHTPVHIRECIGCKTETFSGRTCKDCKEDVPLTGFVSSRDYSEHSIQRGIEWLKFKGVRGLADILAGLLIPQLPAIAPLGELSMRAILVPIPLHPSRLRQRGFNQSEDIARAIGTICSIEVKNILSRNAVTASQARLPEELRALNMNHAFALNIPEEEYNNIIRKKPIIIILDDVSTTGATLISAAKALPQNPYVELWGAAIARG